MLSFHIISLVFNPQYFFMWQRILQISIHMSLQLFSHVFQCLITVFLLILLSNDQSIPISEHFLFLPRHLNMLLHEFFWKIVNAVIG
jgi:hypothetical protein